MIDRFSLRWRVPAIIALILIGAVVTLAVLAYGAARRSAIEVARDRLTHAASTVADLAGNGITAMKDRSVAVAQDPAILEALRNPGTPLRPEAHAALRRLRTDTVVPVSVAVLDAQGRPVEGVAPELLREEPIGAFTPVDTPTVSPFRLADGLLEYVVAAPVRDSGRIVGQVVQWRRVPRISQSVTTIGNLIGDSAVLLIGNADGTAIADLTDTLRAPLIRDSVQAREARERMTSVRAVIPGTPWAWYVEYPNSVIVRPLRLLSLQAVLVALGVLLLALFAGILLSRDMTNALADLTKTAEFIASGDLTRRPAETTRQDEIGRLARSFTTMANRVHDSTGELERRISDRTSDLQDAMARLRETQDELVRKERLATIGQLASSVGHELRNPLGVMSNSVYLLERTMEAPSPKAQDYLRLLRTQIKLSERIVSDLLDSARNPSADRRLVDVRSFIAEQVERVSIPSNVKLEVSVDESLPPMQVDPDQVGQIIVNLLTNGAQSIGQNPGTLSLRARNGDGRIHIDVRDTGPGVPAELAEKIFEPLFTTKARGIGLGLSVSRSLASANGGALFVTNHAEGGAVFTLDVPAGQPA
jgi:C4-dicarboxylate-specific signal transduction histidine kinase